MTNRFTGIWALMFLVAGLTVGLGGCDDGITADESPEVYVNPGQFAFPALNEGEQRDSRVVIENQGDGVLKLADFALSATSNGTFTLYYLDPADGQTQLIGIDDTGVHFPDVIDLGPDERFTLILNYRALDGARPMGSVTMITNDASLPKLSIPISGSAAGPTLSLNPSTVDFERVAANDPSQQTVRLTNTGTAELTMHHMQINGSTDFTLDLNGLDPAAEGAVLPSLAPGEGVDMVVHYTTPTEGPDAAAVSIFTNDVRGNGDQFESVLALRANGASACIHVTPSGLEFPATIIDRTRPLAVSIESCGGEALVVSRIYLTDDTSAMYELDPELLGALPLEIAPMADPGAPRPSRNVSVSFTPEDEQAYGGKLIIESNDPATPIVEVPIVGRGTRNECPRADVTNDNYSVHPLDIVTLDGSPSTDPDGPNGRPVHYAWTVINRPDGSTANPVEGFFNPMTPQSGGRPDDGATATAQFFVDLAGEYDIALVVTDDQDTSAPSDMCPQPDAMVHIEARPQGAIHIQLVWDTPADPDQTDGDGTDVDLHVLHPSGNGVGWQGALDCYYANISPDWGPAGAVGNPSLDIDDVTGAGPENVNIDDPEDTGRFQSGYRVGVHYFRSYAGLAGSEWGESTATVRVFLNGVLDGEWHKILQRTDHFWEAANIIWEVNNQRSQEIDRYYTCVPDPILCP